MKIKLKREGSRKYTKTSFPIRYGCYSEIEYGDFRYQFNLNGEVKHIVGTGPDWPHPAEWLKRSDADDWVFYSVGGYNGIYHLLGEYYLPCLHHFFRQANFRKFYHPALRINSTSEGV